MKTAYSFSYGLSVVVVFLGLLFTGCSAEETSHTAFSGSTTERDLSKLQEYFRNCFIDKVLGNENIEDSKIACLKETLQFCGKAQISEDPANPDGCSQLVNQATKNIIENGRGVDCDSGYCTITY